PHATAVTARVCPRRVNAGLPLRVNQPWTVLSAVAATRNWPSRPPKATEETPAWVGVRAGNDSWAVAASQTRTSPARLPAATRRPWALNATRDHGTVHPVRPAKVRTVSRVVGSQAVTFPLGLAVTRRLPSGLNATAAGRRCPVVLPRVSPSATPQSFSSPAN